MQDWRDQAKKNNQKISEVGPCQFCGADLNQGVSECVDKSSTITHRLKHEEGIWYNTIFLCVDSHALQHAEIHGRWNNHFHLSRLNLILNENIDWNYKLSPLLSEVVNSYKSSHSDEYICPPEPTERQGINLSHIDKAVNEEDYIYQVKLWAHYIFNSFSSGHKIAKTISKQFLEKIYGL